MSRRYPATQFSWILKEEKRMESIVSIRTSKGFDGSSAREIRNCFNVNEDKKFSWHVHTAGKAGISGKSLELESQDERKNKEAC